MKRCARCNGVLNTAEPIPCSFCEEPLCIPCGEVFGECGHPLAAWVRSEPKQKEGEG